MIYSCLLSFAINAIIKYLSLSEKAVFNLKNLIKKNKNFNSNKLILILKVKFSLFFIISFLLLVFFAFYVSCFCGIYENTQTYLIKDTVGSFIMTLIYPFAFNLIPGIFRIPALKDTKGNSKFIYILSKLLQ